MQVGHEYGVNELQIGKASSKVQKVAVIIVCTLALKHMFHKSPNLKVLNCAISHMTHMKRLKGQ